MSGKAYYITTLADWQRHAVRFANSHFIVLAPPAADVVIPNPAPTISVGDEGRAPGSTVSRAREIGEGSAVPSHIRDGETPQQIPRTEPLRQPRNDNTDTAANEEVRILVLIEADEGVHLSLEDEPAFEPLPHPLAQKPISDAAQAALAPHGVAPGATTFDAAETLARIHPLLKHRVF